MDYDNKIEKNELISNQRHKDVLLFLNEELNNLQDKTTEIQTYNLEREYAKTKKNKSPFVFFVLFGCFAVTLGIAFFVTRYIDKQNQNIQINLNEFESLNLKNLLDSVTKVQDKYDNALKQQNIYKLQYDSEIKEAERKRDDDLFLLESMGEIDSDSTSLRRREINSAYYTKIQSLKDEYEPKIEELENEISEYKKELESYDASKIDAARERERALDGERQIQELEKQRIIQMYENQINDLQKQIQSTSDNKSYRKAVGQVSSKYKSEMDKLDPVIQDEKADEIVKNNKFAIVKTFNVEQILTYYMISQEENSEIAASFSEFQSVYDQYKYLNNIIASLPQKNSIPDYVYSTSKLVDKMGQVFEETTISLKDENDELNRQIALLNQKIDELQISYREDLNKKQQEYQKENFAYTECINEMLNHTEHDAVVVTVNSISSISVFVTPRKRYQIPVEGADVEIYGLHVVKASIIPTERGYYRVVPSYDEEGKEIAINLKDIVPGSIVKVLSGPRSKKVETEQIQDSIETIIEERPIENEVITE